MTIKFKILEVKKHYLVLSLGCPLSFCSIKVIQTREKKIEGNKNETCYCEALQDLKSLNTFCYSIQKTPRQVLLRTSAVYLKKLETFSRVQLIDLISEKNIFKCKKVTFEIWKTFCVKNNNKDIETMLFTSPIIFHFNRSIHFSNAFTVDSKQNSV